jgi:hypothetical protein
MKCKGGVAVRCYIREHNADCSEKARPTPAEKQQSNDNRIENDEHRPKQANWRWTEVVREPATSHKIQEVATVPSAKHTL